MRKHEILKQIELRQSTIKDYLSCPLMFRFRHLEKIPPAWRHPAALHGSTLHRLIYLIHRDKWNMDVRHHYREIFNYFEFENGAEAKIPVFWKTDREKTLAAYEQNAVEILDGYRRKRENQQAVILYSEQEFRVKIAGQVFTGTIDQVRRNEDGTLELLDFKSGKQQPTAPFLHNDWQLNLYIYALYYGEIKSGEEWVKPRLLPDYSSWYFLRNHEIRKRTTVNGFSGDEKGEPLIRTEKGLSELRMFRQDMQRLLRVMLRDWHYPNTNHCQICNYARHCMERHQILPDDLVAKARELLAESEAA